MEGIQLPLLWAMLCAYVGAFVLYFINLRKPSARLRQVANLASLVGLLLNLALVIVRAILIQGIPLNNGLEFGMCFVLAMMLTFAIVVLRFELTAIGVFVLPIAVALTAWMLNVDMTISPITPALRSYWLTFHVTAAVIAYGTFAMAFALSVAYFVKAGRVERGVADLDGDNLPRLEVIDEVSYKMVFIGLPFLTIMLVTGAVWAEYAWGTFWSWDPKETFALVTWLVYALYLHVRLMRGWKGKKAALLNILGFAAVIFTFLGVSYLLTGLHSYIG